MNKKQRMIATTIGRSVMGLGCGLWVGSVTKRFMVGAPVGVQVAWSLGCLCVSAASGLAVDYMFNTINDMCDQLEEVREESYDNLV